MTIAEVLRMYDIGQTEFARVTGIPLRTVQDWVAGRRTPPDYLPKMAAAYLSFVHYEPVVK